MTTTPGTEEELGRVQSPLTNKKGQKLPDKREPRRLYQETPSDHAGLVRGTNRGGHERLHAQSSEEEERADNVGGIDPSDKGAARGPDAASRADNQLEDS
jgi:hypothetical protein